MANNTQIKNIEITKKTIFKRVSNEATSYFIYLINFRGYISDNKHFYRYKDIVLIYDDDIFEFYDYEKDTLTDSECNAAVNELIYAQISVYIGLTNQEILNATYEHLNEYLEL